MAYLDYLINRLSQDENLRDSVVFGRLEKLETTSTQLQARGLDVSPYQLNHAMQHIFDGEVGNIYESVKRNLNKDTLPIE